MSFRDVPADQQADAEILAAVLGRVPVRSGSCIRLMSRQEVMDRIEELRSAGEEEASYKLLADLEFDGEAEFRKTFSQVASRKLRVNTSTLYRMLNVMAATSESRNDLLRRVLAPVIRDRLSRIEGEVDEEKMRMVLFSLDSWAGLRKTAPDEIEPQEMAQPGQGYRPELTSRVDNDRLPPDLRKYSRYFLKNLFRLNNIHDDNRFFHPPEVVENYWEVVSPDQGLFQVEMVPSSRSLAVCLYRTARSFGLQRTDNPDYYGLLEMLAIEMRTPLIKGCQVDLQGESAEDAVVLQEALGIETVIYEGPVPSQGPMGIPHPLSPEGLELFRNRLKELSGVRAEVRFPVNRLDPFSGADDYSVLGFDLRLDTETDRFFLDEALVTEATMDQVVVAVGGKLLALSRQLYREPSRFPQPDVEALDAEVHALMAMAEKNGLSDALAREIVAKITVLDYYESLARYSYALSEQLVRYLEGKQMVTLTIPRVLLAILDRLLEDQDLDEIITAALGKGGPA